MSCRTAAFALALAALTLVTSCGLPGRLTVGARSEDVEARRKAVVRARAYATAEPRRRESAKQLLIDALDDSDPEVCRLAVLGLAAYPNDEEARQALTAALHNTRDPDMRETITRVLSGFSPPPRYVPLDTLPPPGIP